MEVSRLESARRRLLEQAVTEIGPRERNRRGQYATPFELASQMVTCALSLVPSSDPIRFLEPGFGTGAFYSALRSLVPASRVATALGVESDPRYVHRARRLWKGTGLSLVLEDFTSIAPPADERSRYNLVACNPPYVRHHHLPLEHKRQMRRRVVEQSGLVLSGLGGLYTYFLVLSRAWMTRGGVGIWLVPAEFMDVNYGRPLKEFLLHAVTLERIHRFEAGDVRFPDALVTSAVVLFRNVTPAAGHLVEFTTGDSLLEPREVRHVSSSGLRALRKWPGRGESRRAIRSIPERTVTLGDLFHIKRGLATGCNDFFVLSRQTARQRKIPKRFLQPLLPSPRLLTGDEILAHRNGEPQVASPRYVLHCSLSEQDIRRNVPSLWSYLEEGKKAGVHLRYLCRHRRPWYAQEHRPPAPFLCTYMGRAGRRADSPFRFILNHSRATAGNVYLLLYPNDTVRGLLERDPSLLRTIWKSMLSLRGEALCREGRVYGGGLYKLEPRELARVPATPILRAVRETSPDAEVQLRAALRHS